MGLHLVQPPARKTEPQIFYLWPEHAQAWAIFMDCGCEWRSGINGRDGLDKTGVEIIMRQASGRRSGFRRKDHDRLWSELHTLEVGAMNAWAKEREKRKSKGA